MDQEVLTHEEVWDDSALLDSWNEALAEYKKYHSLALDGKKVEVPVEPLPSDEVHSEEPQDAGEAQNQAPVLPNVADAEASEAPKLSVGGPSTSEIPGPPQGIMTGVQDENLKNLMMSWYYAGYYTGLYEGQQKAYSDLQQQSG